MRRKTNLFYTTGSDAVFLTFSNYTESLTGNSLATDVKLFPSKFLCLNIPSLNDETKPEFIRGLAAYYENKNAFLRDKCAYNGYNIENKMHPLGWLIEYIKKFDENFDIQYVGQVTEQDYNGVFADTICVIDSTDATKGTVYYKDRQQAEEYDASAAYLYGWYDTIDGNEDYIGPDEYGEVLPSTDEDNKYYYDTTVDYIQIEHSTEERNIEFNVLIPLFDIININGDENTDVIQSMETIPCSNDNSSIINVPYGIWFAKNRVLLSRDGTPWSPSWSLAIGSQFKPFPYSEVPVSEVDQSAKTAAFMTFAQTLTRQNELLDKMSYMMNVINNINERIDDIDANLKSCGTSYNIDGLHLEMADLKSYVSNSLNDMQNEIDKLYIQ